MAGLRETLKCGSSKDVKRKGNDDMENYYGENLESTDSDVSYGYENENYTNDDFEGIGQYDGIEGFGTEENEEEDYSEEQERTFDQEYLNKAVEKRLNRERRKHEKEMYSYNALAETIKNGLGIEEEITPDILNEIIMENLNETDYETDYDTDEYEDNYYDDYYDRYSYKDEEYLASQYAEDIISEGMEAMNEVYEDLMYKDRNEREDIIFDRASSELCILSNENTLRDRGEDPKVLRDEKFIDFASKFRADEPLLNIYDLYKKFELGINENYSPAGSVVDRSFKRGIKDYYSKEEVDNFSQEDLVKNPKLLEVINKSMERWR